MQAKKSEIPKTLTVFRFNLPRGLAYTVTLDEWGEVHGGFQYDLMWLFNLKLARMMAFIEGWKGSVA